MNNNVITMKSEDAADLRKPPTKASGKPASVEHRMDQMDVSALMHRLEKARGSIEAGIGVDKVSAKKKRPVKKAAVKNVSALPIEKEDSEVAIANENLSKSYIATTIFAVVSIVIFIGVLYVIDNSSNIWNSERSNRQIVLHDNSVRQIIIKPVNAEKPVEEVDSLLSIISKQ